MKPATTSPSASGIAGSAAGGKVHLAVHLVAVKLGVQGARRLLGGAAEGDGIAAARHAVRLQPLRFQPADDLGDVVGRQAEAVGELLRREELAILGRTGNLLRGEESAPASLPV